MYTNYIHCVLGDIQGILIVLLHVINSFYTKNKIFKRSINMCGAQSLIITHIRESFIEYVEHTQPNNIMSKGKLYQWK